VSDDHPVREIDAVLDLSWVHSELAPYYSRLGRPSIDPVLMIRMLIVGYVFAIRSERALPTEKGHQSAKLSLNSSRGRPRASFQLAYRLNTVVPLRIEPASKAARGYDLVGNAGITAPMAAPV
jgi:hypothetical protein